MNPYRPQEFEARWQAFWEEQGLHRARGPGEPGFDPRQPKFYVLDMFPYPSGSGLHVGHALGYVGTDVIARKKRMQGFNVLHPMGWDAFGLPAEQYAIQTGKHPRATTDENTANFRRQLKKIGLSYDWSREIDTSQVSYYRWTQWLFNRLHERGLAYRAEVPVWWCEELKTVLANEEVINGRSERGNFPCVRRPLKQWMLKITAYAERLLADLEGLDWPESIKIQQREWIGRSEGAEVRFGVNAAPGSAAGADATISVFTTRPDTLWGATFLVLAPEHALVKRLTTPAQRAAVGAYVALAAAKSELDRTDASKQKTGVFSGAFAHNPVFEKGDPRGRIPIWIADYVLAQYGTGAIMSVPGHDERDFEFAKTFDLEIREVVRPPAGEKGLSDGVPFTGDGTAVNSGPIDGFATPAAKQRTNEWLEKRGLGKPRVTYKLRDWLFSRQRYWGEPFPLLHLADGSVATVPDEFLPVELPVMEDFKPASDGSAPLARAKDWVATIDPRTRKPARRDTDTMPGWAGSCWYWLRFMDPHNAQAAFAKEAEQYWGPVDLYVGGAAHAVMHLLYARFWHKVFFDAGLVHTSEPFQKLYNQGMVTAFAYEDASGRLVASDEVEWRSEKPVRKAGGEPLKQIVTKMAKSLKNVVNPDDIIAEYGCDSFRLYEMFMGPLDESKPWNTRDIPGCRRFCERVWRLFVDPEAQAPVRANFAAGAGGRPSDAGGAGGRSIDAAGTAGRPLEGDALALERALARMLAKAEESFRHFNFNTAIAGMMTFLNDAQPLQPAMTRSQGLRFLACLAPFAPHMAEELWQRMGAPGSVTRAPWPLAEARFLESDTLEIPVQVLGKLRGKISVPKAASKSEIEASAREAVAAQLAGKQVVKVVYVEGRLVNFVVK